MNMSCICNPLECTNWRHSSGSLVYTFTVVKELKNPAFRSFVFVAFGFDRWRKKRKEKLVLSNPFYIYTKKVNLYNSSCTLYIILLDMQSTSPFNVLRIKISFRFALDSSVFNLKENHLRIFLYKFGIVVLKITWKTRLPKFTICGINKFQNLNY